jgi:hypothetical protein
MLTHFQSASISSAALPPVLPIHAAFRCRMPLHCKPCGFFQIPPDLVVKKQAVDIVEVILSLLRRFDVVQTSGRVPEPCG